MDNINYSIIIPHKNIPHLLQRCLDSIPRRDDIQIIVVDDNSDPSIVDFDHFPGVGEKCIEVYFTKEGKGAGYARNVGLRHAKGKWLLFADADDYYETMFIGIIDNYIDDDCDILFYNIYDYTGLLSKRYDNYFSLKANEDTVRLIWVPWNKVFSHELIIKNDILFDEIPVGNDAMFCLRANHEAMSIRIIPDKLYHYTDNNVNSITLKKKDFVAVISSLKISIEINKFLLYNSGPKYCIPLLYPKSLFCIYKDYGFRNLVRYLYFIKDRKELCNEFKILLYKLKKKCKIHA